MALDPRQWPAGLFQLRIKIVYESVTGQDYVNWAVRMMVTGYDSPALVDLAGLDLEGMPVQRMDAEPRFEQAMKELNIAPASEEEVVRLWLGRRAAQIVNRELTPIEGTDLIHWEVLATLNHPKDLMQWCYTHSNLN